MTESDLDTAINTLVELRLLAEKPEIYDTAIKALKEFRQKRVYWKSLIKGVKVVQRVQKKNMKDTDTLIQALIQ